MKKIFFVIILLLYSLIINAQVKENLSIKDKPKIGLALSGGGAKGFAHVGVLKVLDSIGVKIDYVSGTSMGAIVGGLYASGYSGKDIEKIMNETDFYSILSNQKNRRETRFFDKENDKYIFSFPIKDKKIALPSSISTGQNNIYILKELFKNVANVSDFSEFPIPFMCVATDLETGETKIFEEGDIVQSIMASSALPSLLDPVKVGDRIYVDGAVTINYPAQPLKEKGIDIVIGVNLSTGLSTREQLTNIVDILSQINDFSIQKETKKQIKYIDINIHPNLKGMGVTNFDEKEKIEKLGYDEALKYATILDKLPKRNKPLSISANYIFSNLYKIDSLAVENNYIYNHDYIQGKMRLKMPSLQTYKNINMMIDKLYATNNYSLINYDIIQNNGKHILKLYTDEIKERFLLKFGLHYDKIFKTGLLVNFTIKRLIFNNSTISFDAVIGDKPRYYFNYFMDNGYLPSVGAYSSGMEIEFIKNSNSLYEKLAWLRNEIFLQSTWRDKFAIGGGLRHDYFRMKGINNDIKNYINPYAFIKADTQNNKDFPMKGFLINIEGSLINTFDSDTKSLQLKSRLDFSFPINSWISYRFDSFAGFSLGESIPAPYRFGLGGIFEQNLVNNFKFPGYELGQNFSKNIMGIHNSILMNLGKNYYIIPHFSIADMFENFEDKNFLKINYSSVGLTLGYKSPFGQIKVNYSHPLQQSKKGVFNVILGHWF